MILNWFSPLLEVKSEIANFTNRIAPFLARKAQLVFWTNQASWSTEVEEAGEVRTYSTESMPWNELNSADLSVYNIGNDPRFHAAIWAVSQKHPGLTIVHDLRLQHLFGGIVSEGELEEQSYLFAMEREYGRQGRADGSAFLNGRVSAEDMSQRYPLTSLAVKGALALLVHTRESFEWACKCELPVQYSPLPFPVQARAEKSDAALRGGLRPLRLIMFGHIGPNRRVLQFMEVLRGLVRRIPLKLDIFGTLWNEEQIGAKIKELSLDGAVTVRGFVSDEELDAALLQADLAINLRWPSMGEASASQLRIWSNALPSMVTRTGWYAELPEDTVLFVDPAKEAEDILEHLTRFAANPEAYRRIGAAGYRHLVDNHKPEEYAKAIIGLASDVEELRRLGSTNYLVCRTAKEYMSWLSPDSISDASLSTAKAIASLTNR